MKQPSGLFIFSLIALLASCKCPNGTSDTASCQCSDGAEAKTCTDTDVGPDANANANVVSSWGQEGKESGLSAGEWLVDAAQGAQSGMTTVHTPAFNARDHFTFSFDCGGEAHSQLRFFLDKSEATQLELTVSGETKPRALPASTHGTNQRWIEEIIDVQAGPHTYTFLASAEHDSSAGIVIDSFSCVNVEPHDAKNGEVDLDDGFIPVEIDGDWQVDNTFGAHSGEVATHPPAFDGGDEHELTVTCASSAHTQLRFLLDRPDTAQLELTVSDEDEPRALPASTHGTNQRWFEEIIDVKRGAHTYTFRASSDKQGSSGVVVDSISCLDGEPKNATNAVVDFDDGFIPLEIDGDWQVDNALGAQDGDAAAHPPAFKGGDEHVLIVACSDPAHQQLHYFLDRPESAQLELTVSGQAESVMLPPSTHGTNQRWSEQVVDLEQPGPHTYTFRAWSDQPSAPLIVVDSLACR